MNIFKNNNYSCDNQMTFEECLKELEMHNKKHLPTCTAPESRIDIVAYIPAGCDNAISRKNLCNLTGLKDRVVRSLIEEARRNTIIISNNDGSGYWQFPDKPTDEEVKLLEKYVNQQENRAKSIFYALRPARMKLKGGVINGKEENEC